MRTEAQWNCPINKTLNCSHLQSVYCRLLQWSRVLIEQKKKKSHNLSKKVPNIQRAITVLHGPSLDLNPRQLNQFHTLITYLCNQF
jgi:hypothetical protein